MALKLFVALLLLMQIGIMLNLARIGRELSRERKRYGFHRDEVIESHRFLGVLALACALTALVVIEGMVRNSPKPYGVNPWLYYSNIMSGSTFLILFALVLWRFNGRDYPRIHRVLVYSAFGFAAFSLVTGIPMLISLHF